MAEENKKRFPLWIYPKTQQRVQELYEKDNCKSQSEFIEKAIRFYWSLTPQTRKPPSTKDLGD